MGGIQRRYGIAYASPELYLGTRIATDDNLPATLGLVRGLTPAALLVRRQVQAVLRLASALHGSMHT